MAPSFEPSSPVPLSSGVPRLGQHDDGDLREGYQARAQESEPYLHCAGDRWLCWGSGFSGWEVRAVGEERHLHSSSREGGMRPKTLLISRLS